MWLSREQLAAVADTVDRTDGDDSVGVPAPSVGWPSIDGFTIESEVGRGGMGTVYRARQHRPPRTVALKVIDPRCVSRRTLRWFAQEARALGRLEHAAIARIYEAGTFEDGDRAWPYIAMEFAEGVPLTDEACRVLTRRQVVELIQVLADAVQHAHTRGVIHRDLKPGNVIVEPSSSPVRAQIVDFGVAQIAESDWQYMTLHTDAAPVVGTMPYMSPEQITGDPRDIDARTDVYALGVMLYELLAGALPHQFTNRNLSEMARIIRDESPRDLRQAEPSVPRDLATITMKAIARDPRDRYDSARDLATDLERFQDRLPIMARPPAASYRAMRFVQRNALLVGLGTVAFSILVTVTVFLALALADARAANRRALDVFAGVVEPLQVLTEYGGGSTLRAEALPIFEHYAAMLLEQMPSDPRAHLIAGRVRHAKAELAFEQRDFDAARTLFDAVFRELQPWIERPDAAAALCDLAVHALIRRGDSENMREDRQTALATYEAAFDLEMAFVDRFPESSSFRDDLIWGYERVGMMHAMCGHPDKARDLLQRRLKLAVRHWKEDPDDVVRQFGLMCAHQSCGQFARGQGENEVAIEAFEAARRVGEALLQRKRVDERIVYRDRYAGVLSNLASLSEAPAKQVEYFEESFATRTAILNLEPSNVHYGSQYARTAYLLASSHVSAGDQLSALGVLSSAIGRVRPLWRNSIPDAVLCSRFGALLNLRLHVRQTLGVERPAHEPDEAAERLEIYIMLCKHEQATPRARVRLAVYAMLSNDDEYARAELQRVIDDDQVDALRPHCRGLFDLTQAILRYRDHANEESIAQLELAFVRADVPVWFTPPERAGVSRVARGGSAGEPEKTTRGAGSTSR